MKKAVEYLNNPPKQPFFLTVGFSETHREFPDTELIVDNPNYCLPPAPLPDNPETRLDMARFKASARNLDSKIGLVLDALEKNNLAENTLVISTTDHGIAFPRMKCNLQDSGIGVMLIMRGPEGFKGGQVVDEMTSHLDIFPTVCDLLKIDKPDWLRGKSLFPMLGDSKKEIHDTIFTEINNHASTEPTRSVRTKRWKYIKRFDGRINPVLPNCDDGESKSFWIEEGWKSRKIDDEMLFDLTFDPNETCNLVNNPEYETVVKDLKARMRNWMEETNDPLLSGKLNLPVGAALNDPNGNSPREKAFVVND